MCGASGDLVRHKRRELVAADPRRAQLRRHLLRILTLHQRLHEQSHGWDEATTPQIRNRIDSRNLGAISALASVCARKLESRISWCAPSGLCDVAGARKSAGISLVPCAPR